jgi:tetratricopeptide (TPR) repeat protein
MKKLFFLFYLCFSSILFAQDGGGSDQQLAQYYYSNGEFDKAVSYYQRIFEKDGNKFNFNRYYECLIKTENFKEAEKLLKKQISLNRTNYELKVTLGEFYELTENIEKATKIYDELIEDLTPNPSTITEIYQAFKQKNKIDFAFKTLEKGRKLLKDNYPLNFQFAEYYHAIGQTEKMIEEYIDLLELQSNYQETIQAMLSKQIDFTEESNKEYDILKEKLLIKSQKKPNETVYNEMLVWLFIQKKNFNSALIQVQALDKRQANDGGRVFDLGLICVENKDYETARKAFQYIIQLGPEKLYYLNAENSLLNTRFLEVTTNRNFSKEEIELTVLEYEKALQRVGKKRNSLPLILEKAHVQAFYSNQAVIAIQDLQDALLMTGLTDVQRADVKMQLADILVLKGDIWEASLYYMQIDKDFKFEPIGHEAKFKNARIFYYDGEFDFAQSQLNVLKESTSKLIANDAMKLSLLITDNFGIDSNYIAMTWFANGDLLIEQHRYEEAFILFDSLVKKFPYHSLGDEILLKKSRAMQLQGNWVEAINYLSELLKYYSEDILADDALFQLAEINENQLNDKEKAAEYYKKILFEHKGSLYVVEARKRFRALRGDKADEIE